MAELVRPLDTPDTGHDWRPISPFPRLRCCNYGCGQIWEPHLFTPRNRCKGTAPAGQEGGN